MQGTSVVPGPVVGLDWVRQHPEAVLADVRWYLDGRSGMDAYLSGHLPGAVWIDMTTVLSGSPSRESGRHPLPTPESFARGMREAGISDGVPVVAYDDAGGAQAARLVWLLRLLGHPAAVLDGGIQGYDGPLEGDLVRRPAGDFAARPWVPADLATLGDAVRSPLVLDARGPERYSGEYEPVDARAGHIPGAIHAHYADNLDADGRFLPREALRERFAALGVTDASAVVAYCGSGVTACHNLVAMEHAGLGRGRLYPGSWSQYAATDRPAARGMERGDRPRGAID